MRGQEQNLEVEVGDHRTAGLAVDATDATSDHLGVQLIAALGGGIVEAPRREIRAAVAVAGAR